HTLSGFGVGPCTQFSPFARIRASDVLPVPRGPANRYACRTWPEEIAFLSVRTIASCPTTSSKSCGRYFRYRAATPSDLRRTRLALRSRPETQEAGVAAQAATAWALGRRRRVGASEVGLEMSRAHPGKVAAHLPN